VRFVLRATRARQRFYQFTAIDEATRFRVLRIYVTTTPGAIEFLQQVREHFPFCHPEDPDRTIRSLGFPFTWHLSDLGIAHKHIPPSGPEANGKVERSHKTDSEEFYRGKMLQESKGSGSNTQTMGNAVQRESTPSRMEWQNFR
jgi:hypothetical protein